jgi:hypothetical protein
MTEETFRDGAAPVFMETTAEARTQAVPLSHVSLELGHLYVEDFEGGPDMLRSHFARVRPWADAVATSVAGNGRRPRISTCFLVDDYFTRFSSPTTLVPALLAAAEETGVSIDYLARESGCVTAEGLALAEAVESRIVESPPPGNDGSRPPARQAGWLANGERSPGVRLLEAMTEMRSWRPPAETAGGRHSIFVDVELWDDATGRTWSCAFLAAVWQLARLGLLRHEGGPVLVPRLWPDREFPPDWDELPPLLQLNPSAAPFCGYRTWSVLPSCFLPVEHAVRVILDQIHVDPGALAQTAKRSAHEGVSVPERVVDRISYAFYAEP